MKHIIIILFTFFTAVINAQTNTHVVVRNADKKPFDASIDNGIPIASTSQNVLFKNVTIGNHTLQVKMLDGFTINIPIEILDGLAKGYIITKKMGSPMLMQIDVALKNNDIIAFVPETFKTKNKTFLDKILTESVDGKDINKFGLYKKGIINANENQYDLLQTKNAKAYDAVEEVYISLEDKKMAKTMSAENTNIEASKNEIVNEVQQNVNTKKKKGLLSMILEPSLENDEVKINRTKKIKPEVTAMQENKLEVNDNERNNKAKLDAEYSLKQQQLQEMELAKQLAIAKMKEEKIRLDAIAIEERNAAEKIKFLEIQKRKEQKEAEKITAKKMAQDKMDAEKAMAEKIQADAKAKIDAIKLAKKAEAETAQKAIADATAKAVILNNKDKELADKMRVERIMKEAAEAKIRLLKDNEEKEKLAKEKAEFEKAEQAAIALKHKQDVEEKQKLELELIKKQKLAQIAADKKQAKLDAEIKAKMEVEAIAKAKAEKLEKEKQAQLEILAEKLAEKKALENKKNAAAKEISDKKLQEEINAKKLLVAQQAKKEEERLLQLQQAEQSKKIAEEALIAKQKQKAEADAKAELAATVLALKQIKSEVVENNTPALNTEKAPITKLEQKVLKVQNRANPNCITTYTEDELVSIFQKLEMKVDDDSRLSYSKKLLKNNKCFTCKDVEQLSQSYSTQTGQFDFVKAFFPFISDNQNYETLVSIFKYESYKQKIRMEFGGK
jgi:Domain of unknown function (DUF4476)